MKIQIILKYFLFLHLFFGNFSTAQSQVTYEDTQESFKLIFVDPTTAKTKLDQLELAARSQKDSIYGLTLNNLGVYYGVIANNEKSLHHFEKALPYFEENLDRQVKLLSNIAIIHTKLLNLKKTLTILEEALILAKKTKKNNLIALIYGQYASCYTNMEMYNESVDYLIKSIAHWEKSNGKNEQIAIEKQKLGNLYNKTENFEFAIQLFDEALPDLLKAKRLDAYYLTLTSKGDSYLHLKKFPKALNILLEAEKGLQNFNNSLYSQYVWDLIGNTYLELNNWYKAKEYYEKNISLSLTEKIPNGIHSFSVFTNYLIRKNHPYLKTWIANNTKESFKDLLKEAPLQKQLMYHQTMVAYEKLTGNFNQDFFHYDQVISLQDSIHKKNIEIKTIALQTKYQVELKNKENTILNHQLNIQKSRTLKIIIIGVFIVLILVGLITWISLKVKLKKQKLLSYELETKLINEQFEYSKKMNALMTEKIKIQENEILELTAETIEKDEAINRILKLLEEKKTDKASHELKKIKPNSNYWKKIVDKISSVDKNFISYLSDKYPNLTQGDLEICCLLKLNLSSKEIANLQQINVESVFTKKYRLSKKLQLNTNEDLTKWVMEQYKTFKSII